MREFGVYRVSIEFVQKYQGVVNKLNELKIPRRPFVCVKLNDQNWLIPLSSINPQNSNYVNQFKKQRDYNYWDNQNPPKAMEIFDDILGTNIKGYKSVAQYYNAIPIKHKYCKKFLKHDGTHLVVDKQIGNRLKGQLINYIKSTKDKQLTGFIKYFVEKGKQIYRMYPIDIHALRGELYKKQIALKKIRRENSQGKQIRLDVQNRREELKKEYKDLVAATMDQCRNKIAQEMAQAARLKTTQKEVAPQQVGQVQQPQQSRQVEQSRQVVKGKQKTKSDNGSSGKR